MDNEKSIDILEHENRSFKNEVQSLREDNRQLEWTVQSLILRMEMMEARMALFQETVGKLSPPRIEVDLTQEEEVEMVGGPIEHSGPIFLGEFISDHDWYDQLMNSSLLAPESVDPASKDGEVTEHPAQMREVNAGVTSLVEE